MFNSYRITRTGIVFILGVIVLIALVLGAIWFVRDRGEQARRQDAVKVAEQNLENQSETASQPATSSEPAPSSDSESRTTTQTTATTDTSATTELPETGADVTQLIVITLLALAGSYYIVSRRAVSEL